MANITRFDPFNDLVDDLFKGFFVRPMVADTRNALPQELDETKADAKFRDRVHELTLPKKAAAARKAITIQ